nr:MAG TPA: hypothetical protein [Caudoviricetes sp.]
MAKTLRDIGIQKIGQRFVDSIDHAAFTLNGQPKTVPPFRKIVDGSSARVYVYFDDTVIGDVSNVELVDTDGDVVAGTDDRVFTKTQGKGLYVAFKYNIKEMEVESSDEVL